MQVNIEVNGNKAVIWCIYKGQVSKKEYEAAEQNTANATALKTLELALTHMTKSAMLNIEIDNRYVAGALQQGLLTKWEQSEWKTAKNTDVAHADIWKNIKILLSKHSYKIVGK